MKDAVKIWCACPECGNVEELVIHQKDLSAAICEDEKSFNFTCGSCGAGSALEMRIF